MIDLINKATKLQDKLNFAIKELRQRGIDKARTEADYRIALARKMLLERNAGMPVTIIGDICRGDEKIAELKMKRDIAETLYDTCMQAIYATKLEINIVMDYMKSERQGI